MIRFLEGDFFGVISCNDLATGETSAFIRCKNSQSRRIACEAPEMPVSPMTRRTQKRFGCVARHGLKHMKRLIWRIKWLVPKNQLTGVVAISFQHSVLTCWNFEAWCYSLWPSIWLLQIHFLCISSCLTSAGRILCEWFTRHSLLSGGSSDAPDCDWQGRLFCSKALTTNWPLRLRWMCAICAARFLCRVFAVSA